MILGSLTQIAEYIRNPNLKMVYKEGNANSNLDPFLSSYALASKLASHHPQVHNYVGEPVRRLKHLTEMNFK
jgi:hypothetical protein